MYLISYVKKDTFTIRTIRSSLKFRETTQWKLGCRKQIIEFLLRKWPYIYIFVNLRRQKSKLIPEGIDVELRSSWTVLILGLFIKYVRKILVFRKILDDPFYLLNSQESQ